MLDPELAGPILENAERKGKKRFQSKSPEGPSANGVVAPRKKKKQEQAEAVASELKQLRATMDELIEHFRLRVGGDIAELIQRLQGDNGSKTPPAKVTTALLGELQIKPFKTHKGRGKDLARLQELVHRLSDLLPPED